MDRVGGSSLGTFNQGTKYQTRASVDLVAQSGLRATCPQCRTAIPPRFATVNASIVQKLDLGFGQGTELRLDA